MCARAHARVGVWVGVGKGRTSVPKGRGAGAAFRPAYSCCHCMLAACCDGPDPKRMRSAAADIICARSTS